MGLPGLFEYCHNIIDYGMSAAEAGYYWIKNVSSFEIADVHFNSLNQSDQKLLLKVLQKLELNIDSTDNYQAVNDISSILPMNDSHISWFISLKKAKESVLTLSNWADLYFNITLPFQNLKAIRLDIDNEQLKAEIQLIYIQLINSIMIKRLVSFGIDEFTFREKLLSDERQNADIIRFVLIS
jgi:hypothetical protein